MTITTEALQLLQAKTDVLGLILWLVLIADGGWQLYKGQKHWRVYAELVIGIGGMLADGYFVFMTFLN